MLGRVGAAQNTTEVAMDPQPPEDFKVLLRKIEQMQAQIDELTTQMSKLTKHTYEGYYQNDRAQSQQQSEESMQANETLYPYQGRDAVGPPYIPHMTLLHCIRCQHTWRPRTQQPKKCPKCKAPWWFPPKWKWHQSQSQSQ